MISGDGVTVVAFLQIGVPCSIDVSSVVALIGVNRFGAAAGR